MIPSSSTPDIQEETLRLLQWNRLCEQVATFAMTKAGKRRLEILRPATTLLEAQRTLRQTAEVRSLEETHPEGLPLAGVRDIASSLQRAAMGGRLEGSELLDIASTLGAARQTRKLIDQQETLALPELQSLVETLRSFPDLEQRIYRDIDDQGGVADRASPKLSEARAQQQRVRVAIQQMLQSMLQRKPNCFQEALITMRDERFVLPVKVTHRDQVAGILHDTSASGQTLYIEPMAAVEQHNRLREYERQEAQEVDRILYELSSLVAQESEDLGYAVEVLAILDSALARARYAVWLRAVEPTLVRDSSVSLQLIRTRHPLLVWQNRQEGGFPVVPVDLRVEAPISAVVITGPNTGGKTLTLKTLGLVCLMARAGLFIPCQDPALVPWFSEVLADIGDEQSIEQNLSTFSGHIRRISRVLQAAGPQSLVLLDEVGAGTDPEEGASLARALLQTLVDRVGLTVVTTHYGELKTLKYEDDRFENASVEFDETTLGPTYRLLWGIPGRSNALTIAMRLGLEPEIVNRARGTIKADSVQMDTVIAGLEAEKRRQESESDQAAHLRQEVEQLRQALSDQQAYLEQRIYDLENRKQREVTQAVEEARGEIAGVIRRLQKGNASAKDAQRASEELAQLAKERLTEQAREASEYRPKVGEKVYVRSLAQTGEVLDVEERSGGAEVQVRCGVLKLWVPVYQVCPPNQKDQPAPPRPARKPKTEPRPQVALPVVRTEANTIDIRGMRVADALHHLENELSGRFGPQWIIHGHGTGKLRDGVREFLDSYSRKEKYEFADPTDGGKGVTIVFLKG